MNQKKTTPDEQFLHKLYEIALKRGDLFQNIAIRSVAKALGQKETGMKNTIKLLAQANFIRKVDGEHVCLTKQGIAFVTHLEENE